jgi:hypothetical protein
MCSGATAPTTTLCAAGMAIDAPAPATISGATRFGYARPGSAMSPIQPNPIACSSNPPATSARSPTRPARAPAIGATTNSVAVHGSSRTPASRGPWPCAVCRNCAMKNAEPNTDANSRKPAALPAAKARDRNSRMGSIGSRERSSHATKPASSARPPPSATTTSALPQPAALPRTSPHTSPNAAPVTSASPGTSRRAAGPPLSRR